MRIRPLLPGAAALGVCAALALPAAAQFQNPITAAKDAYKKAKEQQKQQQPSQSQPQSGQKPSGNGSAPGSAGSEAPWTPPWDGAATAAMAAPVSLDPAKLPDVLGVHLGMTAQEALTAAHKAFPTDMFVEMKANFWPSAVKPDYGFNIHSRAPGNFKDLSLSFTAPPGEQKVWKIQRQTFKIHTNLNTLISALREKYGKETFAWRNGDTVTTITNDNEITGMLWLYDEQGNHLPMPPKTVFAQRGGFEECTYLDSGDEPVMPKEDAGWAGRLSPWCQTHFVALMVSFTPTDIIENTSTTLEDLPLAVRTARAAEAWLRDYANRQHQEDLQRSKENRPTL